MHVLLRIRNGSEVMGKLVVEEENTVTLIGALTIKYIQSEDGVPQMYFSKYCLFNKSMDVVFPMDCILHIFKDPVPSLIDYYEEQLEVIQATLEKKIEIMKKRQQDTTDWQKQEEILYAMIEKEMSDTEVH